MRNSTIQIGPMLVFTAVCAALAGCPGQDSSDGGTSSGSAASGSCSPLDGVYQFSYTQRSGTCGAQPDELLQFVNGQSVSSATQNCQSGGESMISACELERNSTCQVSDAISGGLLGTTQVTGVLSEAPDYTKVEGTFDVTLLDTTGASCESTYDVIGTRAN
jgi:hypothetical protein